jgi:CubicO group peptidase (beta-lactamase class C family)
MTRRTVACVVVAVLVAAGCGGSSSPRHEAKARTLPQRLDAELAKQSKALEVPGAVAAVVVDGRPVWAGAWGMADIAHGRKMQPDTPVAFASITKMFTASVALRLAEEGRLSLDDPIRRWLPEWRGAREMPVRRLLAQTAGVVDPGPEFYESEVDHAGAATTPADWIAALPRPRRHPSGTPMYANANYILAGLVVKRAAAREWPRLLPRAGSGLALQPDQRVAGRPARGYWYPDGGTTPRPWGRAGDPMVPSTGVATAAWTAGGLAGSTVALARWGDALLAGDTLRKRSLAQMTTFHDGAMWQGYGLGLGHQSVDGREVWGHSGDIPGFHAELWHLPDQDLTMTLAWNDDRVSSDVLPRSLLVVALDAVK